MCVKGSKIVQNRINHAISNTELIKIEETVLCTIIWTRKTVVREGYYIYKFYWL